MMENMSDTSAPSPPATGPTGVDRSNHDFVDLILGDIGASPTPYHAADQSRQLLVESGFTAIGLDETLPTKPGGYVATNGGTLLAWIQPGPESPARSFVIAGAHTDSPNFRVRTHPDVSNAGLAQIGLETYGGLLVNSWLNRDLGIAGRITTRDDDGGVLQQLININQPIMTIPQLAIHLDRGVGDKGLNLNKQSHVNPMWTTSHDKESDPSFVAFLGHQLDLEPDQILSWDLMPYDLQAPGRMGQDFEFIASARIDNLLSSFCAVRAMAQLVETGLEQLHSVPVLVLYDHEEIGSESATGAASNLLLATLERVAYAQGVDRAGFLTMMARSIAVSADGAHATHPNYVDKHDPNHHVHLNAGIVIKRNANQRYATDALSEAFMMDVCREADVPVQHYIHRNDLPCGSTIGPITAARLGISTVDVGAPMLSMHSVRETAGTVDAIYLADALYQAWVSDRCC